MKKPGRDGGASFPVDAAADAICWATPSPTPIDAPAHDRRDSHVDPAGRRRRSAGDRRQAAILSRREAYIIRTYDRERSRLAFDVAFIVRSIEHDE
jgi:hypothetical protein